MRFWPSDWLRASPACAAATVSSSSAATSRSAWAHASSEVSRGNGVQADAETQFAALLLAERPDPLDLLPHGGRRLAPGQVDVGVPGRHRAGGLRAAAEVQRRHRGGRERQRGLFDVDVLTLVRDGLTGPQPADHVEELVAARIPRVLVQVVAEGALFVRLAADDDVEQDPPRRMPGERRRHLCRQGRARPGPGGRPPGTPATWSRGPAAPR